MLDYISQMIDTIWGASTLPFLPDLKNVVMFVFAILLIILTYKLWKFLLFSWWNK